jgi:hypothetical protein
VRVPSGYRVGRSQRPPIELCVPFSGTHSWRPLQGRAERRALRSLDNPLTVPGPLRGEYLGARPSRITGAFDSLRQLDACLAPPLSRPSPGILYDGADFASHCRAATCSTSLRPRLLNRSRRLHYEGPWCPPGPDSHRPTVESLCSSRQVRSFAFMASELKDLGESSCGTARLPTHRAGSPTKRIDLTMPVVVEKRIGARRVDTSRRGPTTGRTAGFALPNPTALAGRARAGHPMLRRSPPALQASLDQSRPPQLAGAKTTT